MWWSTNIFIRIAILGSSLNLLIARPLTPPAYSNVHRLGLPPLPPGTGYSAGFSPVQESESAAHMPLYPSMYQSVDNSQYLPPDVELVPAEVMAGPTSDGRGLVFFSPTSYSAPAPVPAPAPAPAPYMEFLTNGYQVMPYHLPQKQHNHKHHKGGHRPLRPARPIHHPSPTPPTWTIPPDVEVYPHEKPCSQPARPTHAPQPWYPPAIPASYGRLALDENEASEYALADTLDRSLRSASGADYLADQDVAPETTPVTEDHTDSQRSESHRDEGTMEIVSDDAPSIMRTGGWWVHVPFSVMNREVSEVVTEVDPATSTEDSGSQVEPESSDSGFAVVHHSADAHSSDEDSATERSDSDPSEEVSTPKNEDSAPHPVSLDLSSIDVPNMEAVLPEDAQPVTVVDAVDASESVSGDRLVEAASSSVSTEMYDWVVGEELIRAGSNGRSSVFGEDAHEKETVATVISDDVVESETEMVQTSARKHEPDYVWLW